MSGKPFLEGWFYIPVDKINNIDLLKQNLTVTSKYSTDFAGNPVPTINCWDEQSYGGYLGVPVRYGIDHLKELYKQSWKSQYEDRTSRGTYRIETPKQPDLNHEKSHPDQKLLVPQILNALRVNRYVMLSAPTGSGKTVMALSVVAQTGLKTAIFVDTELLKRQWLDEIEDKLGIPPSQVGIVQGKNCDVSKPITLIMVRTVFNGKYADKLKGAFGLGIFDEVHKLGAEKLFKTLGQINPWCMLAMSATIERADKKCKAYKFFFGSGDLYATAPALPLKVVVLPYKGKNWGKNRNTKILAVSKDKKFNERIAELLHTLYQDKRNCLVVCDYKEQLSLIYEESIRLGIPASVCGHVYGGGSKYQLFNNQTDRILKDQEYFKWALADAQIIFATNGMFNKGISVERFDSGIDCTPRTDDTQLRGRVRRPSKNPKKRVWYTFNHVNDRMLANFCGTRIRSYITDESIELVRFDIEE